MTRKKGLEKNNSFFEKLCFFFIHSPCNLEIFYRSVFRCNLLYFICSKFNPQYWYLLLCREKMCWFSSYFNPGSTTAVNCCKFYIFILDEPNSSNAKKLLISHFFRQINFAFVSFQKKNFHLKNFDIMFMFTPWRLLEQYILRVCVFLDHFLRARLVWVFLK